MRVFLYVRNTFAHLELWFQLHLRPLHRWVDDVIIIVIICFDIFATRIIHTAGISSFKSLRGVWFHFDVFLFLLPLCVQNEVIFSDSPSSSSDPPGETRVSTRCQKGGVCLKIRAQPISGGDPPTLCRLFTTEARRWLVERWGKSGFVLRSRPAERLGRL